MAVLGGLLPILIVAAVVYAVFRLVSERNRPGAGGTDGDLRDQVVRLFRLALLFIALVLSAEGVSGLIGEALPRSGELVRDPASLAQALSFTIVGVPALVALARWTRQRIAAGGSGEMGSPLWAAYLGGTLIVALLVALAATSRTLDWVLGADAFDGRALGRLVVWGAVLGVHWVLNRRRPLLDRHGATEVRTPWYLLAGSLIGLVAGATGLAEVVRVSLRLLYDAAWAELLVTDGADLVGRAIALAVPGVAVWVWFWLAHTRPAPRTERWYGYVLLAGVLGGLTVTLIATGTVVFTVLQWLFGEPEAATASAHFTSLPGQVSALLVGGGVWVHHRQTLATARVHRSEIDRIYTYLVALVGLVVSAAAVTLVVAAVVEAAVDTGVIQRQVANPIVLAVTFLAVGTPVWLVFWRRAERNARVDRAEIGSPTRRLYLLVTLGVSAAVALVSLVVLLTGFLTDLTAGDLGGVTLRQIRVPLGLVVSAAAVAAYHGLVYRDDRRSTAPPPPPSRLVHEVVLISDLAPADADAVAERLGGRVVRYTTAAGAGPRPDEDALARAAEATNALTANRALVTVRHGSIDVEGLHD